MVKRCPQPSDGRGSLRWIQAMVNRYPDVLSSAIGDGPITWQSPLSDDEYAEYRDDLALRKVGAIRAASELTTFWPFRGPQWDALGHREDGSEAILVEAKAHIPELFSTPTDAKGESLALIVKTLTKTASALKAKPGTDWSKRFYQYCNRLAFGHYLNELNAPPARLVFVYFIGDPDMESPITRREWEIGIEVLQEAIGLRGHVPSWVQDVFVDVRPRVPVVV